MLIAMIEVPEQCEARKAARLARGLVSSDPSSVSRPCSVGGKGEAGNGVNWPRMGKAKGARRAMG